MSRIVKSARGDTVDFDLLKIKAQIASAPKTTNVKAREEFIDQKFKRRLKRMKREVIDSVPKPADPSQPEIDESTE